MNEPMVRMQPKAGLSPPAWHLSHPEHGTKPWAVQEEALRRAKGKRGYGFWLEQGLGKTPLALNDFYDQWCNDLVDAAVVIAPNSFKLDWADAVAEWGIGEYIRGEYWPNCELPDRLQDQLLAINYEAASRPEGRMKDYLLWLMDQSRVYLIIDESTAIANPHSQQSKAIIELAKRATVVRELNGTPFTRDVMDYYGQLRAIGELNGTNPYAFRNRYAKLGGFMGKQIVGVREESENDLAQLLSRCAFRALKSEWRKDLPPKVYSHLRVEMTKRQLHHYLEMMEDFYTVVAETEVSAEMVLIQMEKLRQISSCLVMKEGKIEWLEKPKDIPKLNAAKDWVEAGSTKAMITCVYKASVDVLQKTFTDMKLKPAVIRGGMTPRQWAEEKKRFNKDSRCRVLVGQQSAVFRGHTLIGDVGDDRCTRMFFYESNFSYYERAQLEDRIHRGDQDQTCVYTDVLTSPIDKHTLNIVTGKKKQADWLDGLVQAIRGKEW